MVYIHELFIQHITWHPIHSVNSKEVDHTLCLSLTYKTLISQTDFEAVVARVTMKWSYILSGMN